MQLSQAGGKIRKQTDLQKAISAGGKIQGQPSRDLGPLSFVNKAIAEFAGAPADIIRSGLNLIPDVDIEPEQFGSEAIKSGFQSLGIETARREPKTFSEFAGQGIGEVTSLLVPVTKAAQLASKGTGLVSKISGVISDSLRKHPALTVAGEVSGGAGAGGGRFLKEEVLPKGSVAGQFTEIGGGLAGGFIPTALTFTPVMIAGRLGKTTLARISLPFTEEGSKFRAGQFLKRQVKEPGEVAGRVVEETIGELPPAVASGEKRLLALYKQFIEADPITNAEATSKLGHSIVKLERELRSLGFTSPEILQNMVRKRIGSIEVNMQKRIVDAMDIAQKKMDALPTATRQSQESVIVRNEIEKVMRRAIDDPDVGTRALWSRVPKDIGVGFGKSKEAYRDILNNLSRAERGDIPDVLRNSFFSKEKDQIPCYSQRNAGTAIKIVRGSKNCKKRWAMEQSENFWEYHRYHFG